MALTLGVIVPCRNEALVIARKLRNLALCERPASERPHRIVVVDDGSNDGTRVVALAELERFDAARVRVEVVENSIRPGKSGAIEQGLVALGTDVDLIVLTDADVVIAPDSLLELAHAFEREPELGMATGAQTFVESLADDGQVRASDGGELGRANTLYDVLTARVRSLESRFGLVFSVHGQLMAWRRELALSPTPGIAADDLDLMLQVRARGLGIACVRSARFFEIRAPRGKERDSQAIRRARAYVQFRNHPRAEALVLSGSIAARVQAWSYLHADVISILAMSLLCAIAVACALPFSGVVMLVTLPSAVLLVSLLMRASPFAWLALAKVQEGRATLEDRWETARR